MPSPLSTSSAVFVTSIVGLGVIITSVVSSEVFPSVSSPSSLISVTSFVFPGLLAVAVAVFIIDPVWDAGEVIV